MNFTYAVNFVFTFLQSVQELRLDTVFAYPNLLCMQQSTQGH